jgi:hypothetical protein
MIPFQSMTSKVIKQAKESEGMINYMLSKPTFQRSTFGHSLEIPGFDEALCYGRAAYHCDEKV